MKINIRKFNKEMKRAGLKNSKALADELEMTRQAIDYVIEKKSTTFKTLNKIAKVFGCSGKDLLT